VLGAHLDELVADKSVEAIVLDVDSPGGSVYGVEELAMKIHAASKQKKIVAVANSMAASAAYWLAAQASELVVTPGGEVGSIGVYMMHRDVSRALDTRGEKVTLVSAGERKTAGHPYGPLEGVALDELQAGVNDYYDKFVRAVARGRNATLTAVREGFGKGGMVRAEGAVKAGMADRVATLDDVLKRWGVKASDLMPAASDGEKPDYELELRKRKLRL
jgi:signal peptide peptidase SppA